MMAGGVLGRSPRGGRMTAAPRHLSSTITAMSFRISDQVETAPQEVAPAHATSVSQSWIGADRAGRKSRLTRLKEGLTDGAFDR